jgi:hypothetical protein
MMPNPDTDGANRHADTTPTQLKLYPPPLTLQQQQLERRPSFSFTDVGIGEISDMNQGLQVQSGFTMSPNPSSFRADFGRPTTSSHSTRAGLFREYQPTNYGAYSASTPSAIAPSSTLDESSLALNSYPLGPPNSEITSLSRSDETRNTTHFGNAKGVQMQLDLLAAENDYLKKDVADLGNALKHAECLRQVSEANWKEKEANWKKEVDKLEVKVQEQL